MRHQLLSAEDTAGSLCHTRAWASRLEKGGTLPPALQGLVPELAPLSEEPVLLLICSHTCSPHTRHAHHLCSGHMYTPTPALMTSYRYLRPHTLAHPTPSSEPSMQIFTGRTMHSCPPEAPGYLGGPHTFQKHSLCKMLIILPTKQYKVMQSELHTHLVMG